MKKKYEKPCFAFELYQLESDIATCIDKVSWGPDADLNEAYGHGNSVCSEYKDVWDVAASASTDGYSQNWYEGSCSCYLSSGNSLVSS